MEGETDSRRPSFSAVLNLDGVSTLPLRFYKCRSENESGLMSVTAEGHEVGMRKYDKTTGQEIPWKTGYKGFKLGKDSKPVIIGEDLIKAYGATKGMRFLAIEDNKDFTERAVEVKEFYDCGYDQDLAKKIQANPDEFQTIYEALKAKNLRLFVKWADESGKERLAWILPLNNSLVLTTLFFKEEIRQASKLPDQSQTTLAKKEIGEVAELLTTIKPVVKQEDLTDNRQKFLDELKAAAVTGKLPKPAEVKVEKTPMTLLAKLRARQAK
jgi:non-homologous end joining protein Ku